MGQVLDAIIRKDLIGSRDLTGISYENINASGNSNKDDVSGSEQGYLLSITYDNGVGLDVNFYVQGSMDGISFGDIPGTETNITDTEGSITWDIVNSNANFVRISWVFNSGSVDVYGQLSAKRRH